MTRKTGPIRSRQLVLGLVVAAAVIAAIVLYTRRDRAPRGASQPTAGPTTPRPLPRGERGAAPEMEPIVAPDRAGDLRLEGQVIDATDDPVAGAVVTLGSNPPRTAKTEDDGSFVFPGLIGRTYRLVARARTGTAGPVTTRLTATSDPVILRLRPAASIEVTVVTAADHRPVASATVELRGDLLEQTTTDALGVARVEAVPPGRHELVAWAPGFAPARTRLRVPAAAIEQKETLALRVGAEVTGRVVDADGAPVAGARVVYAGVSDWANRADLEHDAALTGADGGFRFAALPAGTFRFAAHHAEMAPGESEPITLDGVTATRGVEIRVTPGAQVSGRVVDTDGQPVAGAAVRIATGGRARGPRGGPGRGRRGMGRRGPGGGRPHQTFTDQDGNFELGGLECQPSMIIALGEAASSEAQELDLATTPVRRDVELVLSVDGRIAGTVVDPEGEPVEGSQVRLMPDFRRGSGPPRGDMRLRGMSTVLTDAGGRFEFTGLADQSYRLLASPPGVDTRRRGPPMGRRGMGDAVVAQVGDLDVKIVLAGTGGVKGVVGFSDGSVPSLFTVRVGFRGGATPFNSEDGAFTIDGLAPSGYRLTVSGPDFEPKTVEVEVTAGQIADVGKLVVYQGRKIAGHVVDASGQAVADATVTAGRMVFGSGSSAGLGRRFPGAGQNRTATTDQSGEFVISGVGSGSLALVAEHPTKGRSQAIELPGSSESVLGVELALAPPGSIAGTVTVNGEPGADVMVSAQQKSVPTARFVVATGDDGKFRLDVLAPDSYLLSAMVGDPRHGMSSSSRTVVVSSNQTANGDLSVELGPVTLTVTPTAATALGFAMIRVVSGSVTAGSLGQLEKSVAAREGGFDSRAFYFGEPTRISPLSAGSYSVCVAPFPTEVSHPRDAMEYIGRAAEQIPVFCVATEVTATPAEQSISVPVEIPPYLPPPPDVTP